MTGWFLDYHLVLLLRLTGMATFLGLLALLGAPLCGLRIACRWIGRQEAHGTQQWQRRTQ